MPLWVLFVNLGVLIWFVGAWVLSPSDGEALAAAAFFASFAVLVAQRMAKSRDAPGADPRDEADRRLLGEFLLAVPSEGIIERIQTEGIGSSYRRRWVEPLREFVGTWQNAEHEFLDAELESLRVAFLAATRSFVQYLAANTVLLDDDVYRVEYPATQTGHHEHDEIVREIDRLAVAVAETHQELVRVARGKLGLSAT